VFPSPLWWTTSERRSQLSRASTLPATRPLPRLHRLAPKVFYGWFVAFGCGLLSFVVVGIGFYGLVVFLDALVAEHGWDRAQVAAATSLYWVVTGLVGIPIGRGVDRFGARGFLLAGVLVMALALVGIGRVTAPWQIFPLYVVLGIGFSLAGSIPSGAIITRWFSARRGMAMMLAHTGVSLGGIILVPLFSGWIATHGLAVAVDRLAAILLVVSLPMIGFVLRSDPRSHGLEADGGQAISAEETQTSRPRPGPRSQADILRSPAFRRLAASFGLMLFCQVAFAMHELAFFRGRIGPELAALAVSVTAGGSLVGRLVVGSFADRMDRRPLAAALFLLQAVMVALAASAEGTTALLVAAAGFGFTIGNIFLFQSLLVAELFGAASFGTALGLLQLVSQIASGLGPLALGLLRSAHGAYEPALFWLVGGACGAAGIVLTIRQPGEERGRETSVSG